MFFFCWEPEIGSLISDPGVGKISSVPKIFKFCWVPGYRSCRLLIGSTNNEKLFLSLKKATLVKTLTNGCQSATHASNFSHISSKMHGGHSKNTVNNIEYIVQRKIKWKYLTAIETEIFVNRFKLGADRIYLPEIHL